MMAELKPYPVYKDSGIPWLGVMPAHWDLKRGKTIFNCVDIRSSTGEEELLTVSSERGVVPRSSAIVTMFKAESYVGYKLCWPGDLVINSLWAWARGLGVSQHHGIVSSAYGVYRLRPEYRKYSSFIHELVRSTPFNWELQVRSKGIWTSRLQLKDESFLGAPFPLPPEEDQAAIVRYLGYMDRRIRHYIRAKQKLIKLLEEQKAAIIHRAVTRGLDPNVRLKSSGIEWLGDIPELWVVRRLKWVASINPTKSEAQSSLTENTPVTFLPMERVGIDGKIHGQEHVKASFVWNGFTYFRRKDVLVAKITPCFENGKGACLDSMLTEFGFGSTEFHVLRAKSSIRPQFLYLLTTLKTFRRLGAESMTGAAGQQRVPETFISNFQVAIPSLPEQDAIVGFTNQFSTSIDRMRNNLRQEISALMEYHTRQIADIVTGKLDVREAAARLPEETDVIEPIEEPENGGETDEEMGEESEIIGEEDEI